MWIYHLIIEGSIPEEGYDQEVHAMVCSQPEDARREVHIQFDSKPKECPV